MNKILVHVLAQTRHTVDTRRLKAFASGLLKTLGLRAGELSVVLCDDPFIRSLNRRYRSIPKTTDVLSFAQDHDVRGTPMLLGDVVISIPQAAKQARRRGHALEKEVFFLLVHGVLHIFGYDHKTPQQRREMQLFSQRVLQALSKR